MIFVCVGSREFPFERLIRQLDLLVEQGILNERVVAQIGETPYIPKHLEWHRYLDREMFRAYQKEAELIISHAGTGALIGALKLGKSVISVPRLQKFGEHIDDHQTQISGVLAREGYLREVLDIDDLGDVILESLRNPICKKYDKPSNVRTIIEDKIDEWIRKGEI